MIRGVWPITLITVFFTAALLLFSSFAFATDDVNTCSLNPGPGVECPGSTAMTPVNPPAEAHYSLFIKYTADCASTGTASYLYGAVGTFGGNVCAHSFATGWRMLEIIAPAPPVCVAPQVLSGGVCVDPPPVSAGDWDMPQNQLMHLVALTMFFFMGFRQGFSA